MADDSRSYRDGTPAQATPAFWTRLLIPSMGDTIFIALLAVLTCTSLSVRLLGDAGTGWHIRTGQQILDSHSIPRVDSFSSVMSGQTWLAWEWLYDVMVGALERWAGLNGVVWLTAAVIAGVFAWTFQLLLRRGTNVFVALVLVLLAASASMIHCLARPHVVSWLFVLAWFWILDSSERDLMWRDSPAHDSTQTGSAAKAAKRLWMLPFLMIIWVNVHGGFLVGFVLLAIYWAGAVWYFLRLKEDKFDEFLSKLRWRAHARKLAAVGVAAGAASLVNPYEWRLHAHIFGYLSNRFLMDHIDEFQSPNFHGVAQRCFALLMLGTMIALAARGRELRVSTGLVIFFALYSGLYASRNLPVSSLLLALVIGPWLTGVRKNPGGRSIWLRNLADRMGAFSQRLAVLESSLVGHLWAVAAVVLIFWIAVHGGRLGERRLMHAHFGIQRFPVAAVDFLERRITAQRDAEASGKKEVGERKEARGGAVTTPDYWGGYLIYRLYPRTLVTVDDRHDLYGEKFLKLYLKTVHVEPGWDEFLKKYNAHCVLVPTHSALANILEQTPPWKNIYADDVAVIFEGNPDAAPCSGAVVF